MKIWIVNHYAIPPTEVGGTRHFALAQELIRRGHQVTIIASSYDHFVRKDTRLAPGELWKREIVNGVPFLWLSTPAYSGNLARMWNMVVFALRTWSTTDKVGLERPDVVVGSSPHPFAALAAERIAARYNVPFVLEVRDIWPQSLIEVSKVSPSHPVISLLSRAERYLYQQAAHIVTLLPGAVPHMVERGARMDQITWLPNGVDLRMAGEVHALTSEAPFTVMYAGSHGIANGLDSILDAASLLQQEGYGDRIRMRFIGHGPEKARLQQRAIDEGIELVTFEDPIPKEEIYDVMGQAHAFIVTMRDLALYRHGISFNKVFDYLAMGRPIVFGTTSTNNPVSEAGAGLSVPAEDPVAMANAIKCLSALPRQERIKMGLAGRSHVEENFAFTRLAEKLETVLYSVTGTRVFKIPMEVPLAVETTPPTGHSV